MLNPLLSKAYNAVAAIAAYTIVKHGASDREVTTATAATDSAIGVTTSLAAAQGERVDVIRSGIAEVRYGGNVTRGELLMAAADGKAAKLVVGAGVRSIGVAEVSGVSGDIGAVNLAFASAEAPGS